MRIARPRRGLLIAVSATAVLVASAYVALLWSLDAMPFQDAPNHLARAVISADLLFHAGQRFGAWFTFRIQPAPYILGDLGLLSLVEWLGPYRAGRLWNIFVMLSLPAAATVYLRAARYTGYSIAVGALLSLYLATDWSFMAGFQSYRLGVACTVLTLAAWSRYLENGSRRAFAAYAALLVVGYLTHFSALVLSAAGAFALAVWSLYRRTAPLARALHGVWPIAALLGWELASSGGPPPGMPEWDPPLLKVKRVFSIFHRYEYLPEAGLLAVFAAACALMLPGWKSSLRDDRVGSALLVSAAFLGVYAVMPTTHGYVWWIDSRALVFVPLFAMFALLAVAERAGRERRAVAALALVLTACNLLLIGVHLRRNNAVLAEYRAIAGQAPAGARVMQIPTRPQDNATNPFLHAGMFAVIDAGARTPYLFAGGVTRYFQARSRLNAPSEFWYQQDRGGEDVALELAAAGTTYDFLLVMKPYEAFRGPWVTTEVVAENDAAALLRIVR